MGAPITGYTSSPVTIPAIAQIQAPAHGAATLRLGTRDLGNFVTGALDDVAIYPRVLGEGEIAENCRAAAI